MSEQTWPALKVDEWTATRDTLHMWTQIVGKIRLAHAPLVNHWWQVTLYVSPRGLTTSNVPYGSESFDIEFDFVDHVLRIRTSLGGTATVKLEPRTVASFHDETMTALRDLGFETTISATPNEVDPAIPFASTPSTPRTIPRPRTCSGDSSCRPTGCSISSDRDSSARSAPSTSSGAHSISRVRGSQAEKLRRIRAAHRTAATG